MKFFIVLSVTLACALAEAQIQPRFNPYQIQFGGYIPDAPEVAAAKLAHFEEKAKAAAAAGVEPDYVTSYYINYYKNLNAPAAQITVLPNGYLADTPEVAAAKASHYAEIAKAARIAPASETPRIFIHPAFYGSPAPAQITVLPNGYLADTPEVAAAKSAHYAEHARALYYSS